MAQEFVDGWNIVAVLGEGAFGDVKLLECPEENTFVAMKCIDTKKHANAAADIRKEIAVQRCLDHPNVLKYIGHRTVESIEYIFLEYAPNGELFDRIEPDVGMAEHEAHRFFHHLMSGLDYLHSQGIAHRDIKPENLLLGVDDVLKISDFGFATIFRHKGRERVLDRRCGTMPYVAPEVLGGRYHGDLVDIWSSGVVLVAMLSGELPWDSASDDVREFVAWERERARLAASPAAPSKLAPWRRVPPRALALLRGVLCADFRRRFRMADILASDWFAAVPAPAPALAASIVVETSPVKLSESPARKRRRGSVDDDCGGYFGLSRVASSQPNIPSYRASSSFAWSNSFKGLQDARVSSTQPDYPDCMLLDSQVCLTQATQTTQGSSGGQSKFNRMVKRMTRFVVLRDAAAALDVLRAVALECKFSCELTRPLLARHECAHLAGSDRRNVPLDFRVTILTKADEDDGGGGGGDGHYQGVMLDFRLSKGDGLEFKRAFLEMRRKFAAKVGPIKSAVAW